MCRSIITGAIKTFWADYGMIFGMEVTVHMGGNDAGESGGGDAEERSGDDDARPRKRIGVLGFGKTENEDIAEALLLSEMKAIEARDGIHIPVAAGEPLNSRSGVFNSSTGRSSETAKAHRG
eukprot:TRINITY_DN10258_c0_g1_i1.p1 TRINITY_DN10258_c0_g1~~TRINITY_DN10258_c0_g1_i1.p1  ORF type:complete len:137 (+),score=40.59 TRINITY_DN10258_c0_g1_i1:48-413(+)